MDRQKNNFQKILFQKDCTNLHPEFQKFRHQSLKHLEENFQISHLTDLRMHPLLQAQMLVPFQKQVSLQNLDQGSLVQAQVANLIFALQLQEKMFVLKEGLLMVHYLVLILEPQIHQTHLPRLLRPLLLQVMLQLKVQYQRLLEQLVHRFQVELLQVVGLLLLPLRPLLLLVLGSLGHPPLTNLLQLL